MKLREDAAWSVVVPTSMGVRITPEDRQPVHTAQHFLMQVTSAETNVASVVSYLREPILLRLGPPWLGSTGVGDRLQPGRARGPSPHLGRAGLGLLGLERYRTHDGAEG